MTQRDYQDAVQILKDRIGESWAGVETEGRDEMVRVLRRELGYSEAEAHDAIDAMIASGTLRYVRAEGAAGDAQARGAVATAATGAGATGFSGGSAAGVPLAAAGALGPGHWEIGRAGAGESDETGRKGQVSPEGL